MGASLPNLRPSIRLFFHDDAAKVIVMCSVKANKQINHKKWQDSRPRTGHCDVLPDSTVLITNHCGKRRTGEDSNLLYAALWVPRYQTCDHQSTYYLHSAAPIAAATGSKILKCPPMLLAKPDTNIK